MPRTSTARGAAIATAADLFRRRGYAATGLEEIIAVSGAPKGSFYHHFPGGKEQLAVQSIAFSGDRARERIEAAAARALPGALVTAIAAGQANDLRKSGYELGCPVATSPSSSPAPRTASRAPRMRPSRAGRSRSLIGSSPLAGRPPKPPAWLAGPSRTSRARSYSLASRATRRS